MTKETKVSSSTVSYDRSYGYHHSCIGRRRDGNATFEKEERNNTYHRKKLVSENSFQNVFYVLLKVILKNK